MSSLNLTLDDATIVLHAVIVRARQDVATGTPKQRADAEAFLDWICPTWRDATNTAPPIRHTHKRRPSEYWR